MKPGPRKLQAALISGILSFLFLPAQAQTLKDHLAKGDRFYMRKDYENALMHYLEALHLDADDAQTNLRVGLSYMNRENYREAVGYLEKAHQLNPVIDPHIDYHLALAYQEDQQYAKALDHYRALKVKNRSLAAVATQKIRECILADSLMRIPPKATVAPLQGEINTSFRETFPLISRDGGILIFTSDRSEDEYLIKSGSNFGDVYIARREGSKWGAPEKISDAINVKLNETATSVSADGKTLFLRYEEGGGDIYTSTFENGEWTTPVALNRFINHPQYRESAACVSPDGRKLFFSSNRAGGRGGYDIYVSELGTNGQWGRPSNLGSAINTRLDEDRPFVHNDSTLYFSSNGHATLGNSDILKTTLRKGRWSPPENLGHPINTTGDDGYLVLTADGSSGYYARRRRDDPGNTDIFAITFTSPPPPGAQIPPPESTGGLRSVSVSGDSIVTVLKGTVVDVASATPLEATITLMDNGTKKIVSKTRTNGAGDFELLIPHGGNYGVITEKEGFLFNSMNFSVPAFQEYQEIDTHILMVKAEVGSKVVLKNIFFDVNESSLKPESLAELETIRDLLSRHPSWRIQINGHTDNVGNARTNLALSLKRAEAVVEYLVKQGIDPQRLQAKGFGSEIPLVSNDDEKEGRQINRRTEIEIVE